MTLDHEHAVEEDATFHGHDQVPSEPADGDRFTCSHCGVSSVFVDLNDGLPGEWVDVTPTAMTEREQSAALADGPRRPDDFGTELRRPRRTVPPESGATP